jgi:hypothetical protein
MFRAMLVLLVVLLVVPFAAFADEDSERLANAIARNRKTNEDFAKWLDNVRQETSVIEAKIAKMKNAREGEDNTDAARIRAALTLAKCAREREAIKSQMTATGCFTDRDVAEKYAKAQGKPLIVWMGMECETMPTIRKALGDAVHCHVKSDGSAGGVPQLMYQTHGSEKWWYVTREQLDKCPECWAKTIAEQIKPTVSK